MTFKLLFEDRNWCRIREGCSCDRDLVNYLNSFLVECRKKGNQNNHNGQIE